MQDLDKIVALGLIGGMLIFIAVIGEYLLRRRTEKAEITPVTEEGLKQYDELPSGVAVLMAWAEPGGNPLFHFEMQEEVRKKMPVLARALDRYIND